MTRKKSEMEPTANSNTPTSSAEVQRAVTQELFVESFTAEMERIMGQQNMSHAELARRLGQTASHVTQVLRYGGNLTASTMANIATALGFRLSVRWKPIR